MTCGGIPAAIPDELNECANRESLGGFRLPPEQDSAKTHWRGGADSLKCDICSILKRFL
jgi:hypothetical protein